MSGKMEYPADYVVTFPGGSKGFRMIEPAPRFFDRKALRFPEDQIALIRTKDDIVLAATNEVFEVNLSDPAGHLGRYKAL